MKNHCLLLVVFLIFVLFPKAEPLYAGEEVVMVKKWSVASEQ